MGTWPADYQEQLAGTNCVLCAEGRPGKAAHAFVSTPAPRQMAICTHTAYNADIAWLSGAVGIVVEPTDLSDAEAAAFGSI
ncbi:MAG: hypothetical protein R2911_15710 [Caldilineaceae bacterium]